MENKEKAIVFYHQGVLFSQCAKRCLGDVSGDGLTITLAGGKYWSLSTPAMVNIAFACEVFLKAILLFHDIEYMRCLKHNERHKLKPLFDLLPKEEYKEYLRLGMDNETFKTKLEEHSADFEKWRYFMENGNRVKVSPKFTLLLMCNLEELAGELIANKSIE